MLLYLFPVIAAFAGWLLHLAFLTYFFRQVLPARMPVLARQAARYASGMIVPSGLLKEQVSDPVQLAAVMPLIEKHIDVFLKEKLKEKMPAIAMFIGDKTIEVMKATLMDEIRLLLPELLQQFAANLGQKLDLEKILADRIAALPARSLSGRLYGALGKERRLFVSLGALTGFLTGLILLLLLFLVN